MYKKLCLKDLAEHRGSVCQAVWTSSHLWGPTGLLMGWWELGLLYRDCVEFLALAFRSDFPWVPSFTGGPLTISLT